MIFVFLVGYLSESSFGTRIYGCPILKQTDTADTVAVIEVVTGHRHGYIAKMHIICLKLWNESILDG